MARYKKLRENTERNYDFYHDLAQRESSGKYTRRETHHGNYLGAYQMGKLALIDSGYFKNGGDKDSVGYDSEWKGEWTGKNGVYSKEDFLHSPRIQDQAIREYHTKVIGYMKASGIPIDEYQGRVVGGVKLTQGGMIAAAHLVGHKNLEQYIRSDGKKDPADGNGVPCSDYLKYFDDKRYNKVDMNASKIDVSGDVEKLSTSRSDKETNDSYVVQKGDTLSKIAQEKNLKVSDLMEQNNISNPDKIYVGQEIKVTTR